MFLKNLVIGALCLVFLPFHSATDVRWNAPVIWESSDYRVASEIIHVNLDIEVRTPCMIIDPNMYDRDMMESLRDVCDESYEETMDKLDFLINSPMVLSPSNELNDYGMKTSHSIKKRFVPLLIAGAVGFLATNTYFTYSTMSKASKNELEIGSLKHKMKHLRSSIEGLDQKFTTMVERYDKDLERVFSVFNYTARMNHVSRKAEIALQRIQDAVLQSREKWRRSESSEYFFEVFQVDSLKLGNMLDAGKHLGVSFDRSTNTISISFTVPKVHSDLFVQKAVPVTLLRYEKGETCAYKYTGVDFAIVNANKTCVMPLQQLSKYGSRVLMIPVLACMTHANVSSNLNHYKRDSCHPTSPKDADSFFFQHVIYDKIVLYCPMQQIEIAGSMRDCPISSAFEMPVSQPFKIGKFEHIFTVVNATISQKYDMERTVAINHAYQPLARDLHLIPIGFSYFEGFTDTVTNHWEIALLVLGCLFAIKIIHFLSAKGYKHYKTRSQNKLTPAQMHLMDL